MDGQDRRGPNRAPPHPQGLAGHLAALKDRSGLSYAEIGSRIHAGKSTVYRYCTAAALPPEADTVERFGRVCGATSDEIARLVRLWSDERVAGRFPLATTQLPADPPGVDRGDHAPAVRVPVPVPVPGAGASGPRAGPGARRRRRRAAAVAVALAVSAFASASLGPDDRQADPEPEPAAASSAVPGPPPSWRLAGAPVAPTFFGVTIQSATGAMPTFRTGAARFWDSRTRWANLEPRRGEYDWAILDRLVAGAGRAGLPALFVFGGTPGWAAPDSGAGPYNDGSRRSPPVDLADWERLVEAVASRYRGRIEAYELWVLANDVRFYDGSVETLVEMTRRAAVSIRRLDPAATIVCPSMGRLWTDEGRAVLLRFAELGGYRHCDVAGVKLHQRQASAPPESMLDTAQLLDRLFHGAGLHPRLWNTGTTYEITLEEHLSGEQAEAWATRFYLAGLYGRIANVERMYFYSWGGPKLPVVLQVDGEAPTRAALAVEQLQEWVRGARLEACGHGHEIGLPDPLWQCELSRDGGDRLTIRWSVAGTVPARAGDGAVSVEHLDGGAEPVTPATEVAVGQLPALIVRQPSSPDSRGR